MSVLSTEVDGSHGKINTDMHVNVLKLLRFGIHQPSVFHGLGPIRLSSAQGFQAFMSEAGQSMDLIMPANAAAADHDELAFVEIPERSFFSMQFEGQHDALRVHMLHLRKNYNQLDIRRRVTKRSPSCSIEVDFAGVL